MKTQFMFAILVCSLMNPVQLLPGDFCGTDDFANDTTDPTKWGADIVIGEGSLIQSGGVLRFTGPDRNHVLCGRPWLGLAASTSDWVAQLEVRMPDLFLAPGQKIAIGLFASNTNGTARTGLSLGLRYDTDSGSRQIRIFNSGIETNGQEVDYTMLEASSTVASIRLRWDADHSMLNAEFNPNGASSGTSWTLLVSRRLVDFGWSNLDGGFVIGVFGQTDNHPVLAADGVLADNFVTTDSLRQSPLITIFNLNGQLTWMNAVGTNGFTVEWAPAVTGPWSANWHALDSILSTGLQTTVSVPMFYRVVQGFSLASMRGLWIGASPINGNVYFRAEDNGLLSEAGIFNLRTPNGYFTVTPTGTVTLTFLPKDGPMTISGQIGQPTSALGTLFRVENPALCAGTWSGSLLQTSGSSSPRTYPVSFQVDSSGWVLNFTGFSAVVTGRMYAVANGPAAAFITTGDPGAYNQIQISGTMTGNSFTGSFQADESSVAGTVSLTR